jgi:PAS domain S-box-containing protein
VTLTEHERMQQKLWQEQQFVFQAALNAISDAVYLKDADGRYLAINAAGAAYLGLPTEEIIGRTDGELLSPESVSAILAVDQHVLTSGETITLEESIDSPDGLRVFRSTKGAYVDDAGNAIGVFGISRDITGAKKAEEERRDLQRALELTVEGVARLDTARRFVWVNDAFASLCGFTRTQMVGVPWATIGHPDDRPDIVAAYDELVEGARFDLGMRVVCPDGGSFFGRMTGVIGHAPDGSASGYYCTLRDITDQKRAEEDMRAAGAELERRNGELVSFASLAAHDLRQPLQVISGFAALLAHRCGDKLDEKTLGYVTAICRGADTMDVMVQSLLEFAGDGPAASPNTLVDTGRIVADVVTGLQSILAGGSIVVREPLPVLPGDPAQLARLFQNLIGNAVKFRGEDPPSVEVTAELAGTAWMFRVSDNGIGIGPDFVSRLFGMLQRERRGLQTGTGMGLAICKKIVEYHGGRIWLDAGAAAPGSTFRFTLPADPAVN